MDTTVILAVWMALALAGALAALAALWRFSKHTELRLWTRVAASALLVGALYGAFGTVVGLVKTLGAVSGDSRDPSQSARILAEGLSEALSCTALSLILLVPPIVGLFIVMMRRKSADANDVPR